MDDIIDFITNLEGNQKKVSLHLHQLVIAYPGVVAKIRYKLPFYYRKSWLCYLNPVKGDKVEMVFIRGNELSNSQKLLKARGRKQVMGVIFANTKAINEYHLNEILQEALLLDREVPYASKRSPRKHPR